MGDDEEEITAVSLIDFEEVWGGSLVMGDCRHLWDWLNYNGHIKTIKED